MVWVFHHLMNIHWTFYRLSQIISGSMAIIKIFIEAVLISDELTLSILTTRFKNVRYSVSDF